MVVYPAVQPWSLNISQPSQTGLQKFSAQVFWKLPQSVEAAFDASRTMLSKLSRALFWASLTLSSQTTAAPSASLNPSIKPYKDAPLQDLVTWDEHSIFVRGERIMLFNGEFHPYRLPVPSLWLDILQKLKAAGFSAVSFYTDW